MKQPSKLVFFVSWLFSLLIVTSAATVKFRCNSDDYKVLLKIKRELGDPIPLITWVPNTDCCDWHVVDCNENGRIVHFYLLRDNNISAQIPQLIGDLPYIEELMFYHLSGIGGQIPQAIAKLKNLRLLRLSWTNLSGPIPDFIGQLKNLEVLDLSFNNLTGSIPPSLGYLPRLIALNLGRNKLTGRIPDSLGRLKMNGLLLSHNRLSGTLPRSLGNQDYLSVEIGRNLLEGDASFLLERNKNLRTLDISRNMFQFDLSAVQIPPYLQYFIIDHNKIYGSLPAGLVQLSYINMNASYNRLCGPIPVGSNLQSLDVTVYFHNRCLCGSPLPACRR